MNTLYYGDNLKILREYIKDESVDLIYLDPPFNSNRNYNVLFRNESGTEAEAQITAFEDTWHWNIHAEETYNELIQQPDQVGRMIESFRQFIGTNQMMAYLVMMAIRLKELHRVLKPTGSLYLHCDPTASHYLKIVLDTIFGPVNFRSEVIWRRTGSHNSAKRFGPIHDVILFYSRTPSFYFKRVFRPYLQGHVDEYFKQSDTKGRYWTNALTGSGTRNGESGQVWHGYDPTAVGRHWAIPGKIADEIGLDPDLTVQEKLDVLDSFGFIDHPATGSRAMPTYRQYLHLSPGMPLQDIWAYQPHTKGVLYRDEGGIDEDARWLGTRDKERLGFPTQKSVGLLKRVIESSCPEDGVILDPFCGCGTTIAAAETLHREWIGMDLTHLSVGLQKFRLRDAFNLVAGTDYKVVGQPEDLEGAKELAATNKYGFQWWILPLIGAKAYGSEAGKREGKKGADRGIDGELVFTDDNSGKAKRVIVSVKGGGVNVSQIRDLGHVIDRENAAIGIFLTLEDPSKPMRTEAAEKGFYHSPGWNKDYPRLQILTVADILAGKQPELPPNLDTFKKAQRIGIDTDDQGILNF